MALVIDLLIAAICIFVVIRAYKNGFVKSVMSLVRGIVALVAAYAFTPTLAELIYDRFLLNGISKGIAESISSISNVGEGVFDLESMFETMPETLSRITEKYGTDVASLGKMCEGIKNGGAEQVTRISEYIASPVAEGIATGVSFIVLLAVANLVLSALTYVLDSIFHLPVLNGANKFTGLVLGLLEGILLCVVLGYGGALLVGYLGSIDGELFGEHVISSSFIMRTMSSLDLFGIGNGFAG